MSKESKNSKHSSQSVTTAVSVSPTSFTGDTVEVNDKQLLLAVNMCHVSRNKYVQTVN